MSNYLTTEFVGAALRKLRGDPICHDTDIMYFPSATGELLQSCTDISVASYVTSRDLPTPKCFFSKCFQNMFGRQHKTGIISRKGGAACMLVIPSKRDMAHQPMPVSDSEGGRSFVLGPKKKRVVASNKIELLSTILRMYLIASISKQPHHIELLAVVNTLIKLHNSSDQTTISMIEQIDKVPKNFQMNNRCLSRITVTCIALKN